MLIIRRSNCINTASGIVICVSDVPVCRCTPERHLQRILYHREPAHRTVTFREHYTTENLHTGLSLTENTIPERTCTPDGHLHRTLYQREPAHRTVTYREFYTRCCINTISPHDDEHSVARNMYRIITINVLYNVIVHQVGHLPTAVPGCTVSKT